MHMDVYADAHIPMGTCMNAGVVCMWTALTKVFKHFKGMQDCLRMTRPDLNRFNFH